MIGEMSYLANISTEKVRRAVSVEAAAPWVPQPVCPNLPPRVVHSIKGVVRWNAVVPKQPPCAPCEGGEKLRKKEKVEKS